MTKNKFNLLMVSALVLALGLACTLRADEISETENDQQIQQKENVSETVKKIESYEIRGLKFAYYKIPASLSREDLIKTAQEIHEQETDTQLILVDDESQVADYIKYVKAVSSGNTEEELPKEWADKHIVANVQKYMNGRWVLCESYGFNEITDLK